MLESDFKRHDLNQVRDFVLNSCGISLDATKDYLIECRLEEIREKMGFHSFASMVEMAKLKPTLRQSIIDAISNNETSFFRDESPFHALEHKAIPELIDRKQATAKPRQLRIWSAACSTGQEAYSIAMILCELIPDIEKWDVEILGSDISLTAIQQATDGFYSDLEVGRGLSQARLRQHFSEGAGGWQVNEKLKAICTFEQRDLTRPTVGVGPFDIVFCRNVAIYFAESGRMKLFEQVLNALALTGYLFVGSSESLLDLGVEPHRHCQSVFYRRPRVDPGLDPGVMSGNCL